MAGHDPMHRFPERNMAYSGLVVPFCWRWLRPASVNRARCWATALATALTSAFVVRRG
ncbi:hypothetical protein SAMN05661080_04068 [Modestobacter sp. DSM 44400]|uniref:hypothetical protein n=1 Tax=Modestobacter sp. DSM 44400 TaxID=1550230 RepID=UPI0008976423|nr:hypothetical protein [Modestobacter sp. DSM 44400]SDY62385.1 hypothetical protein SAMN05661080_04068 [Modestobacter sp. DSM 44400]